MPEVFQIWTMGEEYKMPPVWRSSPFSTVAFDYHKMPKGGDNTYSLVGVDLYTHFVFAWAMKRQRYSTYNYQRPRLPRATVHETNRATH